MSEKIVAVGSLKAGWKDTAGKNRFDAPATIQCLYVDSTSIYLVKETKKGRFFFFAASVAGVLALLIQLFNPYENRVLEVALMVLLLLAGLLGFAWMVSVLGRESFDSRQELGECLKDGSAIRLDISDIQKIVPPRWKHPLKRLPGEIHFLDRILVLRIFKSQFKKMLPFLPADCLDDPKYKLPVS